MAIGPLELLIILVVALIVLGPKRLPEAGRQVGRALSEIRRWSQDVKYEMNQAFNPEVVVVRDPTPLAQPAPTPPTADSPDPQAPSVDAGAESGPADAPPEPEAVESPAPAPQAPADDTRS